MNRRNFLQATLLVAACGVATAKRKVMPVQLDDPMAKVLKAFGIPAVKSKEEMEEATGSLVQEWKYPKQGLTFKLAREKPGGPQKVAGITAVAPFAYTTPQGIGLGDSAAAVKQAYLAKLAPESTGELLIVGSVYGGTLFTINKAGKVSKIFWGAAAE